MKMGRIFAYLMVFLSNILSILYVSGKLKSFEDALIVVLSLGTSAIVHAILALNEEET